MKYEYDNTKMLPRFYVVWLCKVFDLSWRLFSLVFFFSRMKVKSGETYL